MWRRRLVALLLVLAAVAVAYLAVRAAALRALPANSPVAAALDPHNPTLVFRQASAELVRNRGRLNEQTYERVAQAARREPTASEPLAFAAMRVLARNDIVSAEPMLVEARRRNPRDRLARLALLGVYLQSRRVAEASAEVAVLVRLIPQTSELLVPELARFAAAPATSDAVVSTIGADPLMGQVLAHLLRNGADVDLVLRLGARQPRLPGGQFAPWQSLLVEKLIERGEVGRAREVWARLVGSRARSDDLIYDSDFAGGSGPPPFNWTLTASGLGSAERASGPTLQVEYFGRASGALATQLLLLRPGRYQFAFRAEGSANGQGTKLAWRVICREGGAPLVEIPLTDVTYTPRQLGGEFSVPASGCASQWLRLEGLAAEFPTTQSARISNLTLRRAGS